MPIIKEKEVRSTYDEVIERLKSLREQQGLTQYELAKSAGLTQPTVTAIEKKTKRASLMTVIRMAKALGEVVML